MSYIQEYYDELMNYIEDRKLLEDYCYIHSVLREFRRYMIKCPKCNNTKKFKVYRHICTLDFDTDINKRLNHFFSELYGIEDLYKCMECEYTDNKEKFIEINDG